MRCNSFVTLVITLFVSAVSLPALAMDAAEVDRLVSANVVDANAVKRYGEAVMPVLVALYKQTPDRAKRARIASLFYQLGWKSESAKDAMMADIRTDDRDLRLQVQWALGRVSSDDRIVEALLHNMQDDRNPLFRDKAACALAYDQIHLTPKQKFRLLSGLVQALSDPKVDVRNIAITALQIHTGQTKGFTATAPEADRAKRIREWTAWLAEYESHL